jgi:DNA-binding transcriptional regulator YbjK
VTTRQQTVLDAAIAVIGGRGMRALTHRAVDAEAGVPLGTTSNYFRTRDALLAAVVARFAERERAALTPAVPPATPRELALVLAGFARTAVGERRAVTLARFALLVEAALRPELQAVLAGTAAGVRDWGTRVMRAAGSPDPALHIQLLGNQVEALTLHQLAYPDPAFDPEPVLLALVDSLLGGTP